MAPRPPKQLWHSLPRTSKPLETERPTCSMLSNFLPPVPSLSSDTPEHLPLRKTSKLHGWVLPEKNGRRACEVTLGWGQRGAVAGSVRDFSSSLALPSLVLTWRRLGRSLRVEWGPLTLAPRSLRAQREAALQAQEAAGGEEEPAAQKGERPVQSPSPPAACRDPWR